MITPLIKKYDVDTSKSILIGDKMSDINAGEAANINTLLLVKSGHKLPDIIPSSVNGVFDNLKHYSQTLHSLN